MENYALKKEVVEQHMKKVKQAIKENKVYFVCIEGCSHKINTFEEYMQLIDKDNDYVFYIYGI